MKTSYFGALLANVTLAIVGAIVGLCIGIVSDRKSERI